MTWFPPYTDAEHRDDATRDTYEDLLDQQEHLDRRGTVPRHVSTVPARTPARGPAHPLNPDERAAQARLRPRTGHVHASPIRPPVHENGPGGHIPEAA